MSAPEQPEPPGGATLHELMHQLRAGSGEPAVRPEEPRPQEQPERRSPRVARKEPGRKVRERAARAELTDRPKPVPSSPEPTGEARAEPTGEARAEPTGEARAERTGAEDVQGSEVVSPEGVVERLAERLAALRNARGWSLEDLARRSGVSRSTLSRVEHGQISPTAAVLVKLAGAYGRTLSGLLAEVEQQPQSLVRAAEQSVTGEDAWRRRVVSPTFPGLSGSVVDAQLLPRTDVTYEPPVAGAEQHLWLITGSLEVTLGREGVRRESHADTGEPGEAGGGDFVLIRGDCLRLRLWGPAHLRCLSPDPARYALFTVAP